VGDAAAHPFARLKSIPLEKLATEPLIALRRKDYSEYYHSSTASSPPFRARPHSPWNATVPVSLITEVEAGRGIALASPSFELVAGKRLPLPHTHGHDGSGSVGTPAL